MSARTHAISGYSPLQQSFGFVDDTLRQQMTVSWEQHFQVIEARATQRAVRLAKQLAVVGGTPPKPARTSLLDLPLWNYCESELDIQPAPEEDHEQALNSNEDDEPKVQWSKEARDQLHEHLLHYCLGVLRSKGNSDEKAETLQWIWAPDIYGWITTTVDGEDQRTPIFARHVEFSFAACCNVTGYDVERMRSNLAYRCRAALKALGMNWVIDMYST